MHLDTACAQDSTGSWAGQMSQFLALATDTSEAEGSAFPTLWHKQKMIKICIAQWGKWEWTPTWNFVKTELQGVLPCWLSGKEAACQCRRQRFEPRSGKMPHAIGQLSLCTTTWACALVPGSYKCWAHMLQLLTLERPRAGVPHEKPSSPSLPQVERNPEQQQRASTIKNNFWRECRKMSWNFLSRSSFLPLPIFRSTGYLCCFIFCSLSLTHILHE